MRTGTKHGHLAKNNRGRFRSPVVNIVFCMSSWLRGVDLNHRPLGYEPNELPDCSTPHAYYREVLGSGQALELTAYIPRK